MIGPVSDRFGRRWPILGGLALTALLPVALLAIPLLILAVVVGVIALPVVIITKVLR